jgi:hypothetical protein
VTLSLESITRVEDADADVPTAALSLVPDTPSRRSVLRMMGLAGLTLGGTVLSWRPRPLTGTARAAGYETAPGGKHTGWLECKVDYHPDPDSGGRYKGWPAACNNAQNFISGWYCRRPSGWHRFDSRTRADGAVVDYRIVGNRCWGSGQGFKSRNAWRWRPPGGHEFRCSDGQMVVTRTNGTSHVYNTVCRWKVAD